MSLDVRLTLTLERREWRHIVQMTYLIVQAGIYVSHAGASIAEHRWVKARCRRVASGSFEGVHKPDSAKFYRGAG